LLTDQLVTLIVGPNLKQYHVHRDLICDRSAHFRAALQGQFLEGQTGRVELPEDEEVTIELFIRWLYGSLDRNLFTAEQLGHYVSVMCFARRILLHELHNDCIYMIRQHFHLKSQQKQAGPTVNTVSVSVVYQNTLPILPTLRFCLCLELALQVTQNIHKVDSDWMDADLSQLLEDGGDFTSDFPKLLILCGQFPSHLKAGSTFAAKYNWLYHVNGGPRSHNYWSTIEFDLIVAAAIVFGIATNLRRNLVIDDLAIDDFAIDDLAKAGRMTVAQLMRIAHQG
ncbi:MAG: hypothetical protein L6R40_002036, partial [Gallowayella cf. fulva]